MDVSFDPYGCHLHFKRGGFCKSPCVCTFHILHAWSWFYWGIEGHLLEPDKCKKACRGLTFYTSMWRYLKLMRHWKVGAFMLSFRLLGDGSTWSPKWLTGRALNTNSINQSLKINVFLRIDRLFPVWLCPSSNGFWFSSVWIFRCPVEGCLFLFVCFDVLRPNQHYYSQVESSPIEMGERDKQDL